MTIENSDVVIIGAGAAGLMCAIEAGKRGRKVIILEHSNKVGKKILMSGGGRCNFTNYYASPENFISHNRHFCKSALSRFSQWDFIALVEKHKIKFHEKARGQLFCDNKAKDIVNMLLAECANYNVDIRLNTNVSQIIESTNLVHKTKDASKSARFIIKTSTIDLAANSLVIATGGLSIPTMGATGFAYNLARIFNLKVYPTRAGLVPITLHAEDKDLYAELSGISCPAIVSTSKSVQHQSFDEDFLFTHRGLSGPAILQISNYWLPGEVLDINLCPNLEHEFDLSELVHNNIKLSPGLLLRNFLLDYLQLPKRVIAIFVGQLLNEQLKNLSIKQIQSVIAQFTSWQVKPNGTEGYRTAEVTLGGIDCDELSSKTMEVNKVPGLYFIGECVDVTGWLGGYNFQWAWSSGWAAGQIV